MNIESMYSESKPVILNDCEFTNQIDDIINPSNDEMKTESSETTNIIVTKYADPATDMLDVEPTLELDSKGKIIEVELLPSSRLQNIENKSDINSLLNKSVIKKVNKRKIEGSENKKIDLEIKRKKVKLCVTCGKEYVRNHELFCKPNSDFKQGDSVENGDETGQCPKCHKTFSNMNLFKRHVTSCRPDSLGSALCSKCGKHFSSNYNLKRHMTSCKLCPDDEKSPRYMCQCGRTYSQEWDMKKHKSKCKDGKKKCKRCLVANCRLLFYHKAQLIAHMKKDHNMDIQDPEVLNFNSFEEFLMWKEKEEEETYTYYSKQTGSNVSGVSVNTYYVCQHDGSDRTHTSLPRKTSRRNKKGRIKTGRLCWSQMNVKQFKDGTVRVTYFPSHTHPLSISDMEHHPLPSSITMEIKRRLSELTPTENAETPDENQEFINKKGRRKRYGMTLRTLRALARKNRSLFRITAEAIQKTDSSKVEVQEEKSDVQFPPKLICSEDDNFMQIFVTEQEENVDDPDEVPYQDQPKDNKVENEGIIQDCFSHLNDLKTLIESGKLDLPQISQISNSLKNFVDKCKEMAQENQKFANQEVSLSSCQVMMSESPLPTNEIFPMQDPISITGSEVCEDIKRLVTNPDKAIYQVITVDNEEKPANEFLFQNAVELVPGAREFILITDGGHAQLIQSVDPNAQFDITS